jgi:hypothetical protein
MLATLIVCSLIFYFFFDFYDQSVIGDHSAAVIAPAH